MVGFTLGNRKVKSSGAAGEGSRKVLEGKKNGNGDGLSWWEPKLLPRFLLKSHYHRSLTLRFSLKVF